MTVFMPNSVVFVFTLSDAIDYIGASNNAAELKIFRSFGQSDFLSVFFEPLIEFVTQLTVIAFREVKFLTGMNKNATTKICAPCPVFNSFDSVDNEPCPGLTNAYRFHNFSISEKTRM